MKVLILSLALFCSSLTASAANVKCRPGDTLLPNPDDCGTFYHCDNGVPRLTNCPPGLHFNPEELVCDLPDNVNCGAIPTTAAPEESTTPEPTTEEPTTPEPTTEEPTTPEPTTEEPTTPEPTTEEPTTPEPTTEDPTTPEPTTVEPTTEEPTTEESTTRRPTTTTTRRPTTEEPTEEPTEDPTTEGPTDSTTEEQTEGPTTQEPTEGPTTDGPNDSTTEEPTEGPTTQEPTEGPTTEPPTEDPTTEDPTTSEPTTEDPNQVICPDEGYLILENPDSCSSFFVCVNGNLGEIKCPNGTDFNPITVNCDLPSDPFCRAGTTEEPPTTPDPYVPPCPANGTIQLPSPTDCGAFYVCINGYYARLQCPDDFKFNASLQACIHPDESTCGAPEAELYFQCGKDGTYANPEDCSSYYVCIAGSEILMSCPPGLHFDQVLGTCNTPEAAQCEITTDPTDAPTTEQPTSPTTRPTTAPPTDSTPKPTTVKPTTTETPDDTGCPVNGTAILPNPKDCTQFIVCIEGEHEVVDCPPGYAFSEELLTCDLAENVGCGTTPPTTGVQCPETGTATLPNPVDCGSYYFCISGHPALINCPSGLNFDESKGGCSETAECSLTTVSPPGSTTSKPTSPGSPTTVTPKPTTPKPGTCKDGDLLPNPEDCSTFFKCANGEEVEIDCPPGLQFDSVNLVCDFPEQANCQAQ